MPRATKTQTKMADELDKALLGVLVEGVTVVQTDDKGTPVPVKITPSAAMFNAIRARLRDLGVNSMPAAGSPADNLAKEAERRGLTHTGSGKKYKGKLPPISDEDDAATA